MDTNHVDRIAAAVRTSGRSSRLTRRRAIQVSATSAASAAIFGHSIQHHRAAAHQATPSVTNNPDDVPVSGQEVPELTGFDRTMTKLIAEWGVAGGQLAVAKDGRLVLTRGYGLADVAADEPVQPDSLFRVASVSKAVTAVSILAMVDDGLLALDDRVFRLLDLAPLPNATVDPRLADITIEHLLVHAGGWDVGASFEPQNPPWSTMAAYLLDAEQPSSPEAIVRMMMGMPLDFDPGSKSIYSNFGYNVLGRVIEQVSGQSYEHFTLDRVLKPAGIQAMRLGRTRAEDRAPGEVHYYGPGEISTMPSAFPGEGFASIAYGFYAVEAMDAHGGWLASAADLVRFATAVDGQRGEPLLTQASFEAMIQTPRPSFTIGGSGGDVGLGWEATPTANGVDWSREGALPETCISWVIRTSDGLALAFTFNTLPAGWADFFPTAEAALLATAADVQTWPDHDLFAR